MHILRFYLVGLLLLSLGRPAQALNDIYVIHFVLDGLRHDALQKNAQEGKIPYLKKFFFEEGSSFEKTLTTFPTVSSPGYISFVSGLGAGNSGVFFLEWFDRTRQKPVGYLTPSGATQVNNDLLNKLALSDIQEKQFNPPTTLFEKLAPLPTASIYSPIRRGATIALPKTIPWAGLFNSVVAKNGLALDPLAMKSLTKVFSAPSLKLPRYTLVALYGTDYLGHHEGPHSEEVEWDLQQFDSLFEKFVSLLQTKGLLDKTYFVLSSDHGMHATGKLLDLWGDIKKQGVAKTDKIYISNRGVSSTFVYAAGQDGWHDLPSIYTLRHFKTKKNESVDLIQTLLKTEGVGWIAAREKLDRVRIYNSDGEGIITQIPVDGKNYFSYSYRGQDPFGYASNPKLAPMLQNKPYLASKWFDATAAEEIPNAVVELANLFQNPKAGDILVMAEEEWGFRTKKAGTHGSLNQGDMHIPLWIRGPQIPKGHFGKAQSIDLYPTILSWFGASTPLKNQEGKFLFGNTTPESQDPVATQLANLEREVMLYPQLSKQIDRETILRRLKKTYPQALQSQLLKMCKQEINERLQRWQKLKGFTEELQEAKAQGNLKWQLAREQNLEYLRLRRMETIKDILESH